MLKSKNKENCWTNRNPKFLCNLNDNEQNYLSVDSYYVENCNTITNQLKSNKKVTLKICRYLCNLKSYVPSLPLKTKHLHNLIKICKN